MKFFFLLLLMSLQVYGSIEILKDTILVKDDPQFEAMLETKTFVKEEQAASLRETGYILATTQFSFENGKASSNWVTMNDDVMNREDVSLDGLHLPKGMAYGILYTSLNFSPRLKVGQQVQVKRYGIFKDNFHGKIQKLVRKEGQDVVQVHFIVSGEELIPGTTCEISIEEIKLTPFKVSLLSLLHLGIEDYVVVKTGAGKYVPKHVTILDQDDQSAVVMLPIQGDEQYVARGAILLKPLLSKIVDPKEN